MFFILDKVFSLTMGLPLGVNSLGFQPNSIKYSPVCCLEFKLNSTTSTLHTSSSASIELYSCSVIRTPLPCSVSANLESFPVFVYLGISFTEVTLGLNTFLTSSSILDVCSLNSANRRSDS